MSLDDATKRELARLAPCRRGRGKLMAMRLLLLAAFLLLAACASPGPYAYATPAPAPLSRAWDEMADAAARRGASRTKTQRERYGSLR